MEEPSFSVTLKSSCTVLGVIWMERHPPLPQIVLQLGEEQWFRFPAPLFWFYLLVALVSNIFVSFID